MRIAPAVSILVPAAVLVSVAASTLAVVLCAVEALRRERCPTVYAAALVVEGVFALRHRDHLQRATRRETKAASEANTQAKKPRVGQRELP